MSHLSRKIIQAVIDEKPLDVAEVFDEAIKEKAFELIESTQLEFAYDDEEDELTEDMQRFFDAFEETYGHLPIEEQEAILAQLEDELDEELTSEGNPDPSTAVTHQKEPLAGDHKPHQKPEGSSPGGVYSVDDMTKGKIERKKRFEAEKNNHV